MGIGASSSTACSVELQDAKDRVIALEKELTTSRYVPSDMDVEALLFGNQDDDDDDDDESPPSDASAEKEAAIAAVRSTAGILAEYINSLGTSGLPALGKEMGTLVSRKIERAPGFRAAWNRLCKEANLDAALTLSGWMAVMAKSQIVNALQKLSSPEKFDLVFDFLGEKIADSKKGAYNQAKLTVRAYVVAEAPAAAAAEAQAAQQQGGARRRWRRWRKKRRATRHYHRRRCATTRGRTWRRRYLRGGSAWRGR